MGFGHLRGGLVLAGTSPSLRGQGGVMGFVPHVIFNSATLALSPSIFRRLVG